MNQFAEKPDARSEVRRHVGEFLDPEYVEKTGESGARIDFVDALDIYLSGEDADSETFSIKSFLKLLKESDIASDLTRKAKEENLNLSGLMDKFRESPDEDIADDVLSLVRRTLG
ncbi:hypothetical protein C4544_04405 [candidate division WS5 bacterium]|uniref:Uncharacterized protein n=1 Tax=candidate division WS5 bacterium TaxID=2093353 RepID=A0A419DCH8_9BACT|nr:MAG: hypothetical protein C4544_04405 [candidate division WS5 bacterium]